MNLKQYWKDVKSRAKALSGVEAVKKGFFGGTGIGPALSKLAKAPEPKRVLLAKEAMKAIDTYLKSLEGKKLDPKQQKNLDALTTPLEKMRKLLKDFSENKIGWADLDVGDDDDGNEAEDGGRGMVVSLDPKDGVIHKATDSIASRRKLGDDASPSSKPGDAQKSYSNVQADGGAKKADFAKAGSNAPIVLLAHGSTPMFQSSKGNVHAVEFGGKSPQVMIDYIAKTLPKTYSGQIYLDGCFTGSGKGTLVYAEQVYKGLVKKGYEYLQIKGNLGAAATVNGKELVTPADVKRYQQDLAELMSKLEPEYTKVNKPWEDEKAEVLRKLKEGQKSNASKEEMAPLMEQYRTWDERRQADQAWSKASGRYLALKELVDKGEKLAIEALTGTWGPEKLPPKT